uniref:NADH-ubiquinone oxidoreductase chain 2 n=1 Tax=Hemidactylus kolliensis TaxID=2583512 RepID=A0A7M1VIK6_9SAUR|nr:NADH dehydrogenase subunit 2 [Hemidactylus kolliensis]
MNPLIWALLLTSLTTSTMITSMSNHWLLAWLGLELNTISMLPIMMKHSHPRMTEATTKYFIIQATAAASILFASTLNAWQTGQWTITNSTSTTATILATTAIMLKLGMAPVHLWYPEILQGMPMHTAMIISTWQKLAPLALLYMMHDNLPTTLIMTLGLLSALMGGLTGLNQTQTRKIMAFSSIAHMGWLLTALSTNQSLATLNMATYIITTLTMFTIMATMSMKTMHDTGSAWTMSPMLSTAMMITLMSLVGLPPLTGFMPKWLVIKELSAMNLMPMSLALLLASLPSLLFYTRLAYLTMLTSPPTTTNMKLTWRFTTHTTPRTTTAIMMACLLLPLAAALYNNT